MEKNSRKLLQDFGKNSIIDIVNYLQNKGRGKNHE